ncbi:uncharacterized protein LOC143469030 isoform X1 [Clavelina lepadiformis]|uniref:uncharacterized protein LOC143469030 isoform X1 n=2 Tax=Clavelina lepadiformis TaxID=159417 RepID=UPI004040FF76
MIPTYSPVPDVNPNVNMQHSPILPPFTPHSRIRAAMQSRPGASPWQATRGTERFPPLARTADNWRHTIDDQYLESMTLLSPVIHTEQNKSFQSATILRSVPIMRRHLDTFGGRTFSLPAKTKPVPFHTGRFIYDPQNRPVFLEELTQNQRLQAEVAMVEKVRGLKRKREALEHRWGGRKLNLQGFEMAKGERYSLQAEIQKLKELILPATARDIYTGRGIRLPEYHHTLRAMKRPTPGEFPAPPPPTTTLDSIREPAIKPSPSPPPRRHQTILKTAASRERATFKQIGPQPHVRQNVDLLVQSVPVPAISVSPTPRTLPEKTTMSSIKNTIEEKREPKPQPQPTPMIKMHEPVEQIEVIEPPPTLPEEEESDLTKQSSPLVRDTPVDRSRSMAAPSASPDGKTQLNPLISISVLEDSIVTEQKYLEMKTKYDELVKESAENISFHQVLSVCSADLTQHQQRFLYCLYEFAAQNQPIGPEEFIAMSCLSGKIVKLSPSIQMMFEQINFAVFEESLAQYTELFCSVDRTARGRIGVGALLQLLGTTLQRQIEPDTKLAQQIMETMQKEYTSDVPKLDFLAYLPYFLYLEEMT